MALLRNREVELLGRADGADTSPIMTVMYKDGNRENVPLSQLTLTQKEHDDIAKQHGDVAVSNVTVIKDKDLQELRDGQDRKKIEEKQGKQKPQTQPVAVSKVMVDPAEVAAKKV